MSARPPIGSVGERILQWKFGTQERATRFYSDQMLDHLNPAMIEFVGRQEIAFVATADATASATTACAPANKDSCTLSTRERWRIRSTAETG